MERKILTPEEQKRLSQELFYFISDSIVLKASTTVTLKFEITSEGRLNGTFFMEEQDQTILSIDNYDEG